MSPFSSKLYSGSLTRQESTQSLVERSKSGARSGSVDEIGSRGKLIIWNVQRKNEKVTLFLVKLPLFHFLIYILIRITPCLSSRTHVSSPIRNFNYPLSNL